MTKRHFELMASLIRDAKRALRDGVTPAVVVERLQDDMMHAFVKLNPRFDSVRFTEACKVDDTTTRAA